MASFEAPVVDATDWFKGTKLQAKAPDVMGKSIFHEKTLCFHEKTLCFSWENPHLMGKHHVS